MNDISPKNNEFMDLYSKSSRLAAAIFLVANVMDQNDKLGSKIKELSLMLISKSVGLKDTSFSGANGLVWDIEKISLELMSLLNIASISGLISKMNADLLGGEFQVFVSELQRLTEKFRNNKDVSVKNALENGPKNLPVVTISDSVGVRSAHESNEHNRNEQKIKTENGTKNGNSPKRKDLRKNMILDHIKGHNEVSIKDIVPNVPGCSEKTVQRELIGLIGEGKIRKTGERRWSRYSAI